MLGWIGWETRGLPRVRHRVELLGGMPLCRVSVGGRLSPLLRLLLRREGRLLREAGIREGVWPAELPEPLRMGLAPVEVAPLRRALLPALLEQAFRQKRMTRQTASALLTAEGTSLPVYWAAQLLAQRVRYLHLETGSGQEGLEDWLLQRYGLACGGGAPELEVTLRSAAEPRALLLGGELRRAAGGIHTAAGIGRRLARRSGGRAASGSAVAAGAAAPKGIGREKNLFQCLTPAGKLSIMQCDLL